MTDDCSFVKVKYDRNNAKLKIAIIRSSFHSDLTAALEQACRKFLISSGVKEKNISTFEAPGSWEIPLIAKKIALTKKFAGIIALGIIIKGETYHFELIASCCSQALMDISLQFNIPVAFEILATHNLKQAKQRSSGKYNKGIEAAKALLQTCKTLHEI